MKSAKLFLIFLSIIILNNCSHHEVKIDAVAAPDQMTDYEGVVTSEKKHSVSLAYTDNFKKMLNNKTMFMIIVENYGDKPIAVSKNNISVMFEGDSVDWSSKKIELETIPDVMKNVQRQIRARNTQIQRGRGSQGFGDVLTGNPGSSVNRVTRENNIDIANAVAKESRAAGVPMNDIRSSFRDTLRGNQELAREIKKMRQDRMDIMKAQSFYAIPRIMLRPQVIMPNQSVSGIFVCDTSEMKNDVEGDFKITVTIDDEEHKFTFTRRLK